MGCMAPVLEIRRRISDRGSYVPMHSRSVAYLEVPTLGKVTLTTYPQGFSSMSSEKKRSPVRIYLLGGARGTYNTVHTFADMQGQQRIANWIGLAGLAYNPSVSI